MKNLARRRREKIIAVNSPFGESCCMRADITLSALSYMAMHYDPEDFPLRLCYAERVFSAPRPPKENLEETQVGVELLGWESIGSDVEVAAMLLRALDALGLNESVLVLGDAAVLTGLFGELPHELGETLLEYLQEGAYYDYAQTIAGETSLTARQRAILGELPWLKGGVEILDKAQELFGATTLLQPLTELSRTLAALGYERRIRIDLGFIRDLNYYCGPIFNVYASRRGELLGGGGRYAGALSETRFSCQAVGFGLSLRELAIASKPETDVARVMLWAGDLPAADVMHYASRLSAGGVPFEISWNADEAASRRFADTRKCSWWISLPESTASEIATGRRVPLAEWGGAR